MKNQVILALFLLFVGNVLFARKGDINNPNNSSQQCTSFLSNVQSTLKGNLSIENKGPIEVGELVVGVTNFNMKRYDEFIKTVTSINGIRNIEYCSGVEVFLIQYDTTVFGSSEEAFRALENKLNGFKIFHKRGPSHAELKENC